MKITKNTWDGKFTVNYEMDNGDTSAFRCTPELGCLIAAAPEMLEALKAIQPILWNDGPLVAAYQDAGRLIESALAKAEGAA
jgi:hypothetical protein